MTKLDGAAIEASRLLLQESLDSERSRSERNRLGQFATPSSLADEIVAEVTEHLPSRRPVSFLDPAFGTGSFYSALRRRLPERLIDRALGFEVDPFYCDPANRLWAGTRLDLHNADFTSQHPPAFGGPVDLLVCNPPYVRHHHIGTSRKACLQEGVFKDLGLRPSGLSGLYVYFLLLGHRWLSRGGVAAWLIPGEFMDVNYGRVLKEYLESRVTLLRIHRFCPEDVQFADALVSSVVVWYANRAPDPSRSVELTLGGSLRAPQSIRHVPASAFKARERWSNLFEGVTKSNARSIRLGDLFRIVRGVATGANEFFVLSESAVTGLEVPRELLTPLLPPPRFLTVNEIRSDERGEPVVLPKRYLLDVRLPLDTVISIQPKVAEYLRAGAEQFSGRYLCRARAPWYAQERRAPAPLLCTYMGRLSARGAPFRFILNESTAIATNVYLMLYPKPILERVMRTDAALLRRLWERLDHVAADHYSSLSRVYGGGLHKFEPRELAELPLTSLADVLPPELLSPARQEDLFQAAEAP